VWIILDGAKGIVGNAPSLPPTGWTGFATAIAPLGLADILRITF
jgi:hypothetical protein